MYRPFLNTMLSLFIFLIILILKADARPPDNDLLGHQNLTHDQIDLYNNTHINMQPSSFLKPHKLDKNLQYNVTFSYNNPIFNEEKNRSSYNDPNNPLLVGFAGEPYKYSVTEEEYMKLITNNDLEVYKNNTGNRSKRDLDQLYNMIQCATDCDPLSYNTYGCYCGFLGMGIPTDAIDRCCQAHDECYSSIDYPFYEVYLQPYLWQCNYGMPRCSIANYDPRYHYLLGCAGSLCECDRQFAMCLRRYQCPTTRPQCTSSFKRRLQNKIIRFITFDW